MWPLAFLVSILTTNIHTLSSGSSGESAVRPGEGNRIAQYLPLSTPLRSAPPGAPASGLPTARGTKVDHPAASQDFAWIDSQSESNLCVPLAKPISVRKFFEEHLFQVWHWLCQWSGSRPRITTLAKPVPHTTNGRATQLHLFLPDTIGHCRQPGRRNKNCTTSQLRSGPDSGLPASACGRIDACLTIAQREPGNPCG
jgi:hypothetical protein